jgi:hypothetical protein
MRHDSTEPVWIESAGRAGDVACQGCSTLNAPTLQFCRHCGLPLHGSLAVDSAGRGDERVSWWRRMGRSARQRAGSVDAERLVSSARRVSSGGVSVRTVMFRSGMAVLLAFGCLALLSPLRGVVFAGARDLLGGERFDQVDRASLTVESVAVQPDLEPRRFPQHAAGNVNDSFANTTWATQWTTDEAPETLVSPDDDECVVDARTDSALQFTFEEPVSLDKIAILGGRRAEDKSAGTFSRPRLIELEVDGSCEQLPLTSKGELEIFDFGHHDVKTVELRVVDIFAESEPQPTTVEIAEVMFGEG